MICSSCGCRAVLTVMAFGVMSLLGATAHAQGFPAKPIRIIVPFPPGGGTDVIVRTVAPKMAETLGQAIVIDNRAGAGGNIGTEAVARSAPDGYTLLAASAATAINTTLARNLSWAMPRDFAPVAHLVNNQSLLVAHPSVGVSSVQELLALARAKPGHLNYGSYGSGSSAHLIPELFKQMASVDIVHVPYKGAGPAVADLVGGQVSVMFADVAAVLPHVKAGKVKALGIGSAQRFGGLPDVPTIAESGVPGFSGGGFIGLVAPAGTPQGVIETLNGAAVRALATPEVRDRLISLASPPVGGSSDQFGSFVRDEVSKWAGVIRSANIKVD